MTNPPSIDQLLEVARRHHAAGQLREAEMLYRRILQQNGDHAEALHLLGVLARQTGHFQDADRLMARSIELAPTVAYFHKNLAEFRRVQGQLAAAEQSYRSALSIEPSDADSHHGLALCFEKMERIDEAIGEYRRAIELNPSHAAAHFNLGVLLERNGEYQEAMKFFDRAIQLRPDYPLARMARAVSLLRLGNYRDGWREYEWRWKLKPFSDRAPSGAMPVWDGSDLRGRTILLRCEQGLGDTLQFIRYAKVLADRGAKVVAEVQPALKRLLSETPGISIAVAVGESLPRADVQSALMSIPGLLGTTPETIPAPIPYIIAPGDQVQQWRGRIAQDASFKVGLVWAGGAAYPNDRNRSTVLSTFAPLAEVPGVTFYSLQKGPPSSQAASPPAGVKLVDLTAQLNNFADTAALLSQLDLVITVDTAVAHLAGGMGKPVWNLIAFYPDFRWFLEREDTPWYPTMRLFRQKKAGDWADPIQRIAHQLRALAGDRP